MVYARNSGKKWDARDNALLERLVYSDTPIITIGQLLGRTRRSVREQIRKRTVTFHALDEAQYQAFKNDKDFRYFCRILLNDGTVRSDLYDGERGGKLLTKRGRIRRRWKNTSSVVFFSYTGSPGPHPLVDVVNTSLR